MKNLSILSLSASVLVLAALTTTAQAIETEEFIYTMNTDVDNTCHTDTGIGSLDLDDAINTTDATVDTASDSDDFSDLMCNYAATVSITSTDAGLAQTSGADSAAVVAGTFINRIDYTATAEYCGESATFTTDGTAANATNSVTCAGANIGSLLVSVDTTGGDIPLLQGTYEDTLTVEIGASL